MKLLLCVGSLASLEFDYVLLSSLFGFIRMFSDFYIFRNLPVCSYIPKSGLSLFWQIYVVSCHEASYKFCHVNLMVQMH